MAVIDFLPVCSKCHQVLWGQEVGVSEAVESNNGWKIPVRSVYPHRCPYCMEEFSSIAMPTDIPFYCEPLWPISVEE